MSSTSTVLFSLLGLVIVVLGIGVIMQLCQESKQHRHKFNNGTSNGTEETSTEKVVVVVTTDGEVVKTTVEEVADKAVTTEAVKKTTGKLKVTTILAVEQTTQGKYFLKKLVIFR